jgi:excisionase family DNA binding protein
MSQYEENERPMSAQKVGERLGVSKTMVYRLADEGKLREMRVGDRRLYWPSDVEQYIEDHTKLRSTTR